MPGCGCVGIYIFANANVYRENTTTHYNFDSILKMGDSVVLYSGFIRVWDRDLGCYNINLISGLILSRHRGSTPICISDLILSWPQR